MTLYSFLRGIINILLRIIFRVKIVGKENIPKEGSLVICANHTNLLDPIVLAITTKRQIYFMAKKELFEKKFFNMLLPKLGAFPVDREGSDVKAVKNSLRVLKENNILGIFPEGTRVDEYDKDNAKAGIAMIALRGKSQILPVYIDTNYKIFSKLNIIIGDIMDYSELYGEKITNDEYKEISEEILYNIYKLKDKGE